MKKLLFITLLAGLWLPSMAAAEIIGSVDTTFKMLGANDQIVIEAFDDPKVDGVSCHLSRAKKGGISGSIGLAEDRSDASIACRQVGPIHFKEPFKDGEMVFTKKTSLLFKTMQVVRFFDRKRNTLIYLVYSDRIIDGSPKNAISTVPVMPWQAK
ncbi:CreA family protein [Magnetococcus marinus MC-1]|uniref:CreA family protein n=1 Tax=Magnetococcus marinus (strain ATCC BAA-1437 / JCM 17883 / MC-1) TaxID=156889 RepID=A0LAI2_MAGMM|nr:CreA family protein [Magnetococcus marinus]ABK44975.1 CreA family protein [Magnetococcus marinus MC-1]